MAKKLFSPNFPGVEFTQAEFKILGEIKANKNYNEIANTLEIEKNTLAQHLTSIYAKTDQFVQYRNKLKQFSALQFFLTAPNDNKTPYRDVRKLIHPCVTTPVNDPVNTPEHSYEVLAKENAELKAKLNVLESNRRIDFSELKTKIKTEIEKMTQKLMLIEEMERMIDNEDDSRTTNPEGTRSL